MHHEPMNSNTILIPLERTTQSAKSMDNPLAHVENDYIFTVKGKGSPHLWYKNVQKLSALDDRIPAIVVEGLQVGIDNIWGTFRGIRKQKAEYSKYTYFYNGDQESKECTWHITCTKS